MGKMRREKLVALLRDAGLDDEADRAERELPERVDVDRLEGKLRSLGLRQEPIRPVGPNDGGGWGGGGIDGGGFN